MARRRGILVAVVGALAAAGFALDPQGLRHARRLQDDLARIQAENEQLRAGNGRLRMELRRLADDPAVLERVAREELGLVRPGDVVFRLEDGDETDAP
ncbi:MAG TPA: septum formation initiator family protein [Vulgatibacter sp.]|nr:septum formation initiator family protein [Vulgatibacter sp.]